MLAILMKDTKKLIIGIDEAGYGPNLGPLVIGGSAWLVPSGMSESEFVAALDPDFSEDAWSVGCTHIPLGDSKKLYRPSRGKPADVLRSLETGLLAMIGTLGGLPDNVQQLIAKTVSNQSCSQGLPWYEHLDELPVPSSESACELEVVKLAQRAATILAKSGIELLSIQASIVTEPEFNLHVQRCGSKGRLLSEKTFELATKLVGQAPSHCAELFCDRQGGRTNYLPLLLEWKPDSWFVQSVRSTKRCSYRSTASPELQVHFTVGGDSFPATALASMAAKYLRERLMQSFNDFWSRHVEDLKPTAGYPVDAIRFRRLIEPIAMRLGMSDAFWWRCR